jgi:hypothetical protein
MEALNAGDYKSVFVVAEPQKIPRHNFYEIIWLLKTGFPRVVSKSFMIQKKVLFWAINKKWAQNNAAQNLIFFISDENDIRSRKVYI